MMHETVFYAFRAILCPEKGIFYCRPVFLNTANRHQDFVVWIKMGLCAGSGLVPRPEAKQSAILPSIGHPPQRWATLPLRFACRRLLCSASRTSRDTPQSSIAWTLNVSLLISRGLKCSNVEGLRFQSHGSSWLTGGSKNRKKALLALETAAIMRVTTRFSGCQLYKLER
jgi:hypothetical protein